MTKLTHISDKGDAKMVDISGKKATRRTAIAVGRVELTPKVLSAIRDKSVPKGDVFATSRIAGIMAAKKTADLIPLCHQIPLSSVSIDFKIEKNAINLTAKAETTAQTGVEMEAMTAVSVAALTLYDMVKGVDKGCVIKDISLISKTGGKSGSYKKQLK